jgi:hypothetical protein
LRSITGTRRAHDVATSRNSGWRVDMKVKIVSLALILVLSLSLLSIPVSAADAKKVTGGLLIASGAGLMLGAFNYGSPCPAGYSSTYTPKTCVKFDLFGGARDAIPASPYMDLRRPPLLYSGAGAVTGGIVLLMLPKRAAKVTKDLNVSVTPKGWLASKTITF